MASKRRVFQVAREFNISNEALVSFLLKVNVEVRNQMSPISDETYGLVRDKFGVGTTTVDENYEFRKKLKEKREQEAAKRKEEQKQLEERIKASKVVAQEIPEIRKRTLKKAEEKLAAAKAKKEAAEAEAIQAEDKKPAKPKRHKKVIKVIELKPTAPPKKTKEKPTEITESKEKEAKPEAKVGERKRGRRKRGKQVDEIRAKSTHKGTEDTTEAEISDDKLKAKKGRGRKKKDEKTEKKVEAKDRGKKKAAKRKKPRFDKEEIEEAIRETLAKIDGVTRTRRHKRKPKEAAEEQIESVSILRVPEFISAGELADLMDVEPPEVLRKCMELGMMVTINQRLDGDVLELVASEYGYDIEIVRDYAADMLDDREEEEDLKLLKERPPVVTIMGHVDHGKTSLLDYIRKSNILAREAGGITQHIGAYEVAVDKRVITFLDTPGHEAFTAMRARGAQVTDIVVLVVAADDSVMPQTIEAINHAKAANVSIIVAINKMDKPGANADMIRQQLSENGVLVEDWGGKFQCVEISAKTGQNVDKLLELILLEADVMELKANPDRLARGAVIESRLDKGKGAIATVLVETGSLNVGDPFIAGQHSGKVRTMFDEFGRKVKKAMPSQPVAVLGFNGVPEAGDTFIVLESERDTKEISLKRQQLRREQEQRRSRPTSLDQISQQIKRGDIRELLVVLKGDVGGSIEAIDDTLSQLSNEEVAVRIIHRGVGAITESDVLLAIASGAIIIGFNVRPTLKAREVAKLNEVDVRLYDVIYNIKEDVKSALEGFLKPTITEELTSTVEIRDVFRIPRVGNVAGCYVLSGKVLRNDRAKIYRDDKLIHDGRITSLKRFKEDVKEVPSSFECGIGFERYDDFKVGDIIETYALHEQKRTL